MSELLINGVHRFPAIETSKADGLVETASYVIFKDGNIYYAKNGKTGEIEFSGTDIAEVLQSVVDAFPTKPTAPYGGKVVFKRNEPNTWYDFNGATINVVDKNISFEGETCSGVVLRNVRFNYTFTSGRDDYFPTTIFKNLRFLRTIDAFADEAIFLSRVANKKIENCEFSQYDKAVTISAKSGEAGYSIKFDNCTFETSKDTTKVFVELVGESGVNYPQDILFNCRFRGWYDTPAEKVPSAVYANPGTILPIVFINSWFAGLHSVLKVGSNGVREPVLIGNCIERCKYVISTDDEDTPSWRNVKAIKMSGNDIGGHDYIFNYVRVFGEVQPFQAGTHIGNEISPGNPAVEFTQVYAKIPNGTSLSAGKNTFTFNNSGRVAPLTEDGYIGDNPVRVDVLNDGGIGEPFTVLARFRGESNRDVMVWVIVSSAVTLTGDLRMKITLFP